MNQLAWSLHLKEQITHYDICVISCGLKISRSVKEEDIEEKEEQRG